MRLTSHVVHHPAVRDTESAASISKASAFRLQAARSAAFSGGSPVQLLSVGRGSSPNAVSSTVKAAADADGALSKEWPTSYSHFYEDITENLRPLLFLPEADPEQGIQSVMSTDLRTTAPDAFVGSILGFFDEVTGLPVLDESGACVGVISKKDVSKKTVLYNIDETRVGDVMSSPAITIHFSLRVADAAAIMLKHKIHRIPVVDDAGKVVGLCTRKDIFTALGQEA